jgi:hypothetical protein
MNSNLSGPGNGLPPGRQAQPWKVAVPFALGALLLFGMWLFGHKTIHLIMGIAVAVWGAVWVLGARRSLKDTVKIENAPGLPASSAGQLAVISRAGLGLFPKTGLLLFGGGGLFFRQVEDPALFMPGQQVEIKSPASQEQVELARLENLNGWRHVSGFFGTDKLILRMIDGGTVTIKLKDPEALQLLLQAFSTGADD